MRQKGRQSRAAARGLTLAATAAAVGQLLVGTAVAGDVAYPKAAAKIQLRIPDDWSAKETAVGLELEAPRKDSLVIAAVVSRDKAKLDAWVQSAVERMKAEGVNFLNEGESDPDALQQSLTPQLDAPSASTGSGEIFTFSGAPALGKAAPPSEQDYLPKVATKYGLPPSVMATGKGAALSPFSHFYYKNTTLHGKSVDVELALYALGKDQVFVIEQMSGPVDPRGVMIVRSLRTTS